MGYGSEMQIAIIGFGFGLPTAIVSSCFGM